MIAPRIKVIAFDLTEAPIGLRLPFRYGAVTLHHAVEARVTIRIQDTQGREADGFAAEVMAPKWFDKSPNLTNAENVAQLRHSVRMAAARYLDTDFATAFELHAANDAAHIVDCARQGLSGLIAAFGNAQLDKAVLSALRNLLNVSRIELFRLNFMGLDTSTAPDLADVDLGAFLLQLKPRQHLAIRHTVGGLDPLRDQGVALTDTPKDDLPVSLEAAIKFHGLSAFKLKLSGDIGYDAERLILIAEVLEPIPRYLCTLDGNEQFESAEHALSAWHILSEEPRLKRLVSAITYLEQPLARDVALQTPLGKLADAVDVEIDESDDSVGAFPAALNLGYKGTSIKSCKGVFRAILNAARVKMQGRGAFISAEDLCTQPGPGVEDDLAMAALLGVSHIERNGHYFGNGVSWDRDPTSGFSPNETAAIYRRSGSQISLNPILGSINVKNLVE